LVSLPAAETDFRSATGAIIFPAGDLDRLYELFKAGQRLQATFVAVDYAVSIPLQN
jgi:hypothetical protein